MQAVIVMDALTPALPRGGGGLAQTPPVVPMSTSGTAGANMQAVIVMDTLTPALPRGGRGNSPHPAGGADEYIGYSGPSPDGRGGKA